MHNLGDHLKMLVVDDDDVDRERVLRFLNKAASEVEVVEAESGSQALHLLRTDIFDCIVLDNHLGDTTGAELIKRIEVETKQGCPIIMVTGAGNESLAVQAMMDGAYDYLPKTQLSSDSLLRSVSRAVELHKVRCELKQVHESLEQRVDEQAAQIRQREKDLRALVDNAPTAMGYWDRDQRCGFGNVRLGSWFQVDTVELRGMHLRDLLGQALYERVRYNIELALKGQPQEFEQSLQIGGDDEVRWVYWQLRPDLADDGQCLGFYSTLSDITVSRKVQARVEELLHFSDAVIHTSPIGMAVFERDGHCILTNQAFVDTCGPELDWKSTLLWDPLLATVADGLPRRIDVPLTLANGQQVQLACSLARFDQGGGHHVLMIARDVTDQIKAHEALVAARDSAESAARAKSAFLANMSHEIRTPMNAIVGFSRLTLEDELPLTARGYIEKIHTSALALMDILDDVLDYSKIEAGYMHLEHTRFVLEDVLQRAADLFQARIEQKNLSFIVDVAPDVPREFLGDPLRLSQVLTNLIGNAIKFTDHGHIQLKVDVARVPDDGGQMVLAFSVSDTGVGIDPDIQSGLFEAFNQGDSSITRRFGGTGLGLAICKRLVNLMGGEIGIHSVLGQGSEFWFTVGVTAAVPGTSPSVQAADVSGRRVLVLDENPLSRQSLVKQLQAWHVSAQGCADVAAGLAQVERLRRNGFAVDTLLVDSALTRDACHAGLDQLNERVADVLAGQPLLIHMATQSERMDVLKAAAGESRTILMKPVLASRLLEALHAGNKGAMLHGPHPPVNASAAGDLPLRSDKLRALAQPLQGARILLVEDNVLNQIVADEFLRRCGMRVTIVDDGAKAVSAVQAAGADGFEAVLMDMHMPVMDGLEATRRIKAWLGPDQSLPIIGMTAAVLPEDKVRCADAGMVDHIAKPVIPEHVIAVLLRWVTNKGGASNGLPKGSLPEHIEAPPDLRQPPGMDLEALRERVHGNQQLVWQLLAAFVEHEGDAALHVVDWAVAQNWDAALRKMHDLKGSAANLGLMDFSKACATLHQALKQSSGVEAALTDFVNAHTDCMTTLKRLLRDKGV